MNDGIDGMGFQHFTICPWIPEDMNQMSTTTRSLYGDICSEYTRTNDGFDFHFIVPANSTATVILPVNESKLAENGQFVTTETEGVLSIDYSESTVTVVVGSGNYHFSTMKEMTGIHEMKNDAQNANLPMQCYNLSGIPSMMLPNGIYIQNGKKMLIRQ